MTLTVEIWSLTLMTLFYLLAFLPASIGKKQAYGRAYLLSNRDATNLPPLSAWAERANRAYENLKSYFPAYVVAILTLAYFGKSDTPIKIAAVLYVISRLIHFVSYTCGFVFGRASGWIVGLVANIYLLIRILC